MGCLPDLYCAWVCKELLIELTKDLTGISTSTYIVEKVQQDCLFGDVLYKSNLMILILEKKGGNMVMIMMIAMVMMIVTMLKPMAERDKDIGDHHDRDDDDDDDRE